MSSRKSKKLVVDKAYQIVKAYLGGPWKKSKNIVVEKLSGGLTNHVYKISIEKTQELETGEPSEVLLRLFGQNAPTNILEHNVIFTLLSERSLGPRLLGVFVEGRLEEYIHGRSLTSLEMSNSHLSAIIGQKLSMIHSLNVPILKEPDFIHRTLISYLTLIKNINLNDYSVDEEEFEIASKLLAIDLDSEVLWLYHHMTSSKSPIVFCHNDLQGGNILLKFPEENGIEIEERILFIDYEFAAYGYRAYDLANHFSEWMFDYNYKEFPYYTYSKNKFPSSEHQMNFLVNYISSTEKSEKILKSQARNLMAEVQSFLMAPHLLWALWGMAHSKNTTIPFGYWHYAQDRLNEYFSLKKSLSSLMIHSSKRVHEDEEKEI